MRKLFLFCALCGYLCLSPGMAESSELGRIIGGILSAAKLADEPVGAMAMFKIGSMPPPGWQPCDGRPVFRNSPLWKKTKKTPDMPSDRKGYVWWIKTR